MKKNNLVLPLIIILLLLVFPCAVYGVYSNLSTGSIGSKSDNITKRHLFEGKLYFYSDGNLVGTYECKTDACSDVKYSVDDTDLLYNSNENVSDEYKVYKNEFALIYDNDENFIYNLTTGTRLISFKLLKNYGFDNSNVIVENSNDEYGVMDLSNITYKIRPEYEHLSAMVFDANDENQKYLAKKEGKWFIIDLNNTVLSSLSEVPIVYYNNRYIVTKENELYQVKDYQGNGVYFNMNELYTFKDKLILKNDYLVLVIDFNGEVTYRKDISSSSVSLEEGILKIMVNDTLIDEVRMNEEA